MASLPHPLNDSPPKTAVEPSGAPIWDAGFDGFFAGEYPRLVRLLWLVVADESVAEQIAQDGVAELVGQWRSVSTSERPDTWLRTIALRVASRRDRQQRIRRGLRLAGAREPAPPKMRDGRGALLAATATLSMRQRSVLALHSVEGRSLAEVAEILGCRPTAASADLSRATVAVAGSLGLSVADPALAAAIREGLRAATADVAPDVDLARRSISLLEEERDSRRRFRLTLVGGAVAVALLLVGALAHPWTTAPPDLHPAPSPVPVSGLYGLWRAEVAGAGRPVLLTLAPSTAGGGFTAYLPCGEVNGGLAVTSLGAFAATVDGSGGRCSLAHGSPPAARWLESAVLARQAGARWNLLDVDGHPVATLHEAKIGAFPRTIDLLPIRTLGHVPPLPADERAALDRVVTVPAGATAARAGDLIGTWYPPDPSRAFLRFNADGTYDGSDGWHCSSGRWSLDGVGQLAFSPGRGVTLGCHNRGEQLENLPQWFADADVVGVGTNTLRLYDDTGRLLRTVSPVEPSS